MRVACGRRACPRQARHLPIHPAGYASQYRQCQRQAGADDVSPPGHEQYFEELVKLVTKSGPPDAGAIAKLRAHFDTEQLSSLKAS
jgi:hypothetical protein